MPRQDAFGKTVEIVRDQRLTALKELLSGNWEGESAARALVAKVQFADALLDEMRHIGGPGTVFATEDLLDQ